MKKSIKIGEYEGKFFLIGSDGYATTEKQWTSKEQAEKARIREQKLEDAEKPSNMRWNY